MNQVIEAQYKQILEPKIEPNLKLFNPVDGCQYKYTIHRMTTIGRDPQNQVRLLDLSVALYHAKIEFLDGTTFKIRDLKSDLGTFVNGTKIIEVYINDGDKIQIGPYEFKFSLSKDTNRTLPPELKSRNAKWNNNAAKIPQFAKTGHPVLILGSSGSGKEIIAHQIHELSDRNLGPFVGVNCSALTESLIESELFGHIKGSFTGAVSDRKGAFEMARGGTLFLDEIGDLPYCIQAKLLRAIENHEIRPVGSDRNIRTDVRIISATHQNLTEKIKQRSFRPDLFYRLNVIHIKTPRLIDRMEDFEDLFYRFCKEFHVRFNFGAIQTLKAYSWPGNIRELKNLVARAGAFYGRKIVELGDLPAIMDELEHALPMSSYVHSSSPTSAYEYTEFMPLEEKNSVPNQFKEMEKQMIEGRLRYNVGNQRRTATDLGIPKSTLNDKIRVYNIDAKSYKKKRIKARPPKAL